ncbi:MAG: MmcQ/YjbR family DNA-binding protein [Candidatus Marinimicrobia bacterium]|jgi:predicted DNA-binding protein (MmcQ/YjbR family)|nr:MmcQ/YjbR family DNA-binding protein [Candidatus Neomarinimicrobiota bacterium]MBT3630206.1 MmcQ/YjbR family DNA-binding protein [Candidatus Neomarinimicrobiota bacterium]MBT3824385.1 MmcQ/YjbR family DNA-binding protein [Candidatus Neomarinimicrobiota bacterium]MBT4132388.1 MmcQ/YjbR family DNA-binding protein [Candidatus Neomarinimicrobiota bacterium]MBT4294499.1 MmcQ/YjbR family DNA-binding protein [Candidatus Neomarinimicrobiota bacterium]
MTDRAKLSLKYADFEARLLSFKGSSLSFPFDEKTAVFKVANKMFALVGLEWNPLAVNLKCDPDDAQILRSQFEAITAGYHMNKDHWNTVTLDGSLEPGLVNKLIEDSYLLVVRSMSKREQKRLGVS